MWKEMCRVRPEPAGLTRIRAHKAPHWALIPRNAPCLERYPLQKSTTFVSNFFFLVVPDGYLLGAFRVSWENKVMGLVHSSWLSVRSKSDILTSVGHLNQCWAVLTFFLKIAVSSSLRGSQENRPGSFINFRFLFFNNHPGFQEFQKNETWWFLG